MSKNVVIIPGLHYHRKGYDKLIKNLSDYKVHFFNWDYNKPTKEAVKDLSIFLKRNHLRKTSFITHSYGSVIFRLFYKDNRKKVERVVEIAPLNKKIKLLKKTHKLFPTILRKYLGRAYQDFLYEENKILNLKLPGNLGVIAGDKKFNPWRWEFYIIPFFYHTLKSDGKIAVSETKPKKMKDFTIVHDTHSRLISNEDTIKKIKNFLENLSFN